MRLLNAEVRADAVDPSYLRRARGCYLVEALSYVLIMLAVVAIPSYFTEIRSWPIRMEDGGYLVSWTQSAGASSAVHVDLGVVFIGNAHHVHHGGRGNARFIVAVHGIFLLAGGIALRIVASVLIGRLNKRDKTFGFPVMQA